MNRTLFQIEQSMMNLLDYGVNDETGEMIESEEEFALLYEQIQLDLNTKIDNTNCLSKLLDGEIEVIDKEIKRLEAEKKSRENKVKWLKNRIDEFIRRQYTDEEGNVDLEGLSKFKLDLPHSKITYRKSESVEVDPDANIPEEYMTTKIVCSPNKKELSNAIKSGKEIQGVRIVKKSNIQIK